MAKIKAIIKRPDEQYGHVCNISDSLQNLQKTVGGRIEIVPFADVYGGKAVVICNEEGKILNLPFNMRFGASMLVGTVIVCGIEGEDLADIPINLKQWKIFVDNWENGL